jgi:hypothetical protein
MHAQSKRLHGAPIAREHLRPALPQHPQELRAGLGTPLFARGLIGRWRCIWLVAMTALVPPRQQVVAGDVLGVCEGEQRETPRMAVKKRRRKKPGVSCG